MVWFGCGGDMAFGWTAIVIFEGDVGIFWVIAL